MGFVQILLNALKQAFKKEEDMFAPRIKNILATAEIGSTISVTGWVQKKQKRSEFSFVDLNDGSCLQGLQIIIDNDVEDYENFARLSRVGASVSVEGKIMYALVVCGGR